MPHDARAAEIPLQRLAVPVDLGALGITTSRNAAPAGRIVGQEAALRAMKLGLELYAPGYNIFVTGITGTGRFATVVRLIRSMTPACALAPARAYVHNFDDPDRPILVSLRRGRGHAFREAVDELREAIRAEFGRILEGPEVRKRDKDLREAAETRMRRQLENFENEIRGGGFALVESEAQGGRVTDVALVLDGARVTYEQALLGQFPGDFQPEDAEELLLRFRAARRRLLSVLVRNQDILEVYRRRSTAMARRALARGIRRHVQRTRRTFGGDCPAIPAFLDALEAHVLRSFDLSPPEPPQRPAPDGQGAEPPPGAMFPGHDPLALIAVNILIDHDRETGCPLIVENHPTCANLFGTIEPRSQRDGPGPATFLDVKPGSMLRADGGYIIMSAHDVLSEPGVWSLLKTVIKTGTMSIVPREGPFNAPTALKPEPIPINVKVVLVGEEETYSHVLERDDDFSKTFKVKAEFDDSMPRSDGNVREFVSVVAQIIEDDGLLHLDAAALRRLVEEAVRMTESGRRITTRFSDVADLLREATYHARAAGADGVGELHVLAAIRGRRERVGLAERHVLELIREGTLHHRFAGRDVGEINGLAFHDLGYAAFGSPGRISATIAIGTRGVISIERESRLSGRIHDKGVLIVTGYLSTLFGQHAPLALSAQVCFEQNYGGVDGDSASAAEVLAILSALSGVPLRQDLAITGSIDQRGRIQAIGGVNEKILGFLNATRAAGVDAPVGVVIPAVNVPDLMLDDVVLGAVRGGRFRVLAAASVPDALRLLTDEDPGTAGPDGIFPPESLFGRAGLRLHAFAAARARSRRT